jgi:hypothetical protein
MGDDHFAAILEEGRRLSLDEAVELIESYGNRHTRQV